MKTEGLLARHHRQQHGISRKRQATGAQKRPDAMSMV
jgi:hypothetical protein